MDEDVTKQCYSHLGRIKTLPNSVIFPIGAKTFPNSVIFPIGAKTLPNSVIFPIGAKTLPVLFPFGAKTLPNSVIPILGEDVTKQCSSKLTFMCDLSQAVFPCFLSVVSNAVIIKI